MPPTYSVKGKINTGESGSEINFNIRHLDDDIIRVQFDDDEELINMFCNYLQTQEPENEAETILQEVELFG